MVMFKLGIRMSYYENNGRFRCLIKIEREVQQRCDIVRQQDLKRLIKEHKVFT